jgi:hypothetical protein
MLHPATISNCLRKASLLPEVPVNNKTITESKPGFSGWLKQGAIKTFKHVLHTEE